MNTSQAQWYDLRDLQVFEWDENSNSVESYEYKMKKNRKLFVSDLNSYDQKKYAEKYIKTATHLKIGDLVYVSNDSHPECGWFLVGPDKHVIPGDGGAYIILRRKAMLKEHGIRYDEIFQQMKCNLGDEDYGDAFWNSNADILAEPESFLQEYLADFKDAGLIE